MVPDPRKTVRAAELRYLNQPQPIRVEADAEGVPRVIRTSEHIKNQISNIKYQIDPNAQRVHHLRDHWRVDEGWWRESICRFYYEVELEDGRVVVVYRDSASEGWYEQRYGQQERKADRRQ